MNVLALDYGKKRIGVAVGNTASGIAFVRDFIPNNEYCFDAIAELCKQEKIEKIIIGKPIMLGGEDSDSTQNVEDFYQILSSQLSTFNFELIDERFSTNIAQSRLNQGMAKQSKKKSLIDSSSAQVLLENYFGRH